MKSVQPTPRELEARAAVLDALKAFPDVPEDRVLALMAYTTGQCIAFLDQRKFTPAMAMAIVGENMEAGNAQAIEHALGGKAAGNA